MRKLLESAGGLLREILDTHGRVVALGAIIVAFGGGTLVAAILQAFFSANGLFLWSAGILTSGLLIIVASLVVKEVAPSPVAPKREERVLSEYSPPVAPSTIASVRENPKTGRVGEKSFLSISPQTLTGFFGQGHTSIQAAKLAEPYIGKWLSLSGTVYDVQEAGIHGISQGRFVTLREFRLPAYVVLMKFSEDWIDQLSTLRPGDTVTIEGKIASVSDSAVLLDNCELQS